MRRLPILTACALAVSGVATAGDAAKERDALKGTWTLVELTEGGKKEDVKGMEVTISGNAITMTAKGEKVSGTFKVDPSKKPKTIDVMMAKGEEKKTMKGIYELAGDTLRVCHFRGPKGETDYPGKIEATEDTAVAVLKRAK